MANEPQWKQSIERPLAGWDYDGKRILGHIGHDVCLWDAKTGELVHRMKGHNERIFAVQFSPDGSHAISCSWRPPAPMQPSLKSKDTSTILWNLGTGRDREIFKGQIAGEFSPDGRKITTFSQRQGKLEITDEYTDPESGKVEQRRRTVLVPRFDAAVWDTFTGRQLVKAKLDDHADPDDDTLHFSPDGRHFVHLVRGRFLAYNSSGGVVFNSSDGREIGRVSREAVKFGGGHRYTSIGALATFDPRSARLIDFQSSKTTQAAEHDLKKGSWGALWTHDGSKVAVISYREDVIRILDVKSGEITIGAKTHPKSPSGVVVSPDNSRLAMGAGGNPEDHPQVRLYDMNTGEEIARMDRPKAGSVIGFSPDSKTLLIGGAEFIICNAENGEIIRALSLLDEGDLDRWSH